MLIIGNRLFIKTCFDSLRACGLGVDIRFFSSPSGFASDSVVHAYPVDNNMVPVTRWLPPVAPVVAQAETSPLNTRYDFDGITTITFIVHSKLSLLDMLSFMTDHLTKNYRPSYKLLQIKVYLLYSLYYEKTNTKGDVESVASYNIIKSLALTRKNSNGFSDPLDREKLKPLLDYREAFSFFSKAVLRRPNTETRKIQKLCGDMEEALKNYAKLDPLDAILPSGRKEDPYLNDIKTALNIFLGERQIVNIVNVDNLVMNATNSHIVIGPPQPNDHKLYIGISDQDISDLKLYVNELKSLANKALKEKEFKKVKNKEVEVMEDMGDMEDKNKKTEITNVKNKKVEIKKDKNKKVEVIQDKKSNSSLEVDYEKSIEKAMHSNFIKQQLSNLESNDNHILAPNPDLETGLDFEEPEETQE